MQVAASHASADVPDLPAPHRGLMVGLLSHQAVSKQEFRRKMKVQTEAVRWSRAAHTDMLRY